MPRLRPQLLASDPRAWFALLAIAAIAFHAAWLDAPFSLLQMNAGVYFGVFCNNWDQFGFWELRGLPLMPQLVADVADGNPYVHHPPGLSWLFYLLGGHEWSMRLPTTLASFLASAYLYRLARTWLTPGPSFLAATLLLLSPGMAVVGQASYEPMVVACGMIVMAEIANPCRSRAASLSLQIGAAFLGTWFGWGFAFLGLACAPLAWQRQRPIRSFAKVLPAGIAALIAVVTIDLWTDWALAGPGITPPGPEHTEILSLLRERTLDGRGGFEWAVRHILAITPATWSRWLQITFVVGIWFALRRCPRIALAGVIAASLPYIILRRPVDLIWQTYAMPMLAICGAALLQQAHLRPSRAVRLLGGTLAATLVIGVAYSSWTLRSERSATFFRNLGAVLSEAAREPDCHVVHNYTIGQAFYFQSPRIGLRGQFFPADLTAITAASDDGWSYLWLRAGVAGLEHPGMEAYLAPFPKRRVPELEGPLDGSGVDAIGGIREAWLVTLQEPKR